MIVAGKDARKARGAWDTCFVAACCVVEGNALHGVSLRGVQACQGSCLMAFPSQPLKPASPGAGAGVGNGNQGTVSTNDPSDGFLACEMLGSLEGASTTALLTLTRLPFVPPAGSLSSFPADTHQHMLPPVSNADACQDTAACKVFLCRQREHTGTLRICFAGERVHGRRAVGGES